MVFPQHSGARDLDRGVGFQHSGSYRPRMVVGAFHESCARTADPFNNEHANSSEGFRVRESESALSQKLAFPYGSNSSLRYRTHVAWDPYTHHRGIRSNSGHDACAP